MKRFWIGSMLIATTNLGRYVPAGQAQSDAAAGFSSSKTVSDRSASPGTDSAATSKP
jgi:hypothetical protein